MEQPKYRFEDLHLQSDKDYTDINDTVVGFLIDKDVIVPFNIQRTLEDGIDGDVPMEKILSIISDKWSDLSDEEKDELISAFSVPTTTHYVDKSRMVILKEDIEKISRTDADLVPQMGLRNYTITFTNGENVYLRF